MGTSDGKKFTFFWAENYLYPKKSINDFIIVGDSIYKNIGSDSVFIYRKNEIYYFVLEKRINKIIDSASFVRF